MSLDAFFKHPQTFSIWMTVCWTSLKNILIASNTFVSLLEFGFIAHLRRAVLLSRFRSMPSIQFNSLNFEENTRNKY